MPTNYQGDASAVSNGTATTIIGASTTTPIVIQTSAAHLYATNDIVSIDAVGGMPEAEGDWRITVTDSTHFSLNDSVGSGTYTSGGTAIDNSLLPFFQIPSDGDDFNAAAWNVAIEALADRTQKLADLVLVPKSKTFLSGTTWNPPTNIFGRASVELYGGGGGGGGGAGGGGVSAFAYGGGGGGGARKAKANFAPIVGDTYTIVIGTGGTGGTNGPAGSSGGNGGDGGDTSLTDTTASSLICVGLGAMGGTGGHIESTGAFAAAGGRSCRSTVSQNTTLWHQIQAVAVSGVPFSTGDAYGGDGVSNSMGSQGLGGWNNPDSGYSPGVGGLHGSNSGSYNGGGGGGGGAPGPGGAAPANGGPAGNGNNAGTGGAGTTASNATDNTGSGAGGGGGGGAGSAVSGIGGVGGVGGSGSLTIYWYEIGRVTP